MWEGGKAARPLPAGFLARRHHLGMGILGPSSSASVTDPMSWRDCLLMEYFSPVDSIGGEQCLLRLGISPDSRIVLCVENKVFLEFFSKGGICLTVDDFFP